MRPAALLVLLACLAMACVELAPPASLEVRDAGANPGPMDGPREAGQIDEPGRATEPAPRESGQPAALGAACQTDQQCESGFCRDGVCCAGDCADTCFRCDAEGGEGTCSPVPDGEDPHGDCASSPEGSCGLDGLCDGAGTCRRARPGSLCAPARCSEGQARAEGTCDDQGTCQLGAPQTCGPFLCGETTCASTCTEHEQCATGSFCDPPQCLPKRPAGMACRSAVECTSGRCVDGVCCLSACAGSCEACNVPGALGTCTPVPAGEDPADDCPQDPPGTCVRDGTCDGNRGCRRYRAGTECAPGACIGAVEYAARLCDGEGRCLAGTTRSCPGACSGAACATGCTSNTQCQNGFHCAGGRCLVKKTTGASCSAASECASGFCADGVCCESACTSTCFSCNGASVGMCRPVPPGQDPRENCVAQSPATCGRTGACNGAGACALFADGTTCRNSSCASGTETPAAGCDGSGVCVESPAQPCTPFVCGTDSCLTTCSSDSHCDGARQCRGGRCILPDVLLHWRLDETSGSLATDHSGNGFHGTYAGNSGAPIPSASVAPVSFANPRSRLLDNADRQGVMIGNIPAALTPTGPFTLSAWFNTTVLDSGGADVINGTTNYVLRLHPDYIEFKKRIQVPDPSYSTCTVSLTSHLDGRWHHLAAVNDSGGMRIYVDGTLRCSNTKNQPVVYAKTATDRWVPELWVGRNPNRDQYDYEGLVDDVRIYGRSLTPAEVAALAAGGE